MSVHKCKKCLGTGIVTKRLSGINSEGKPLDDGELHPTRCWTCAGSGYLDEHNKPVHYPIYL